MHADLASVSLCDALSWLAAEEGQLVLFRGVSPEKLSTSW